MTIISYVNTTVEGRDHWIKENSKKKSQCLGFGFETPFKDFWHDLSQS